MKLSKFMKEKGQTGINFYISLGIGIFTVVLLFFVLAIAGANLADSTTDATAINLIGNFTDALNSTSSQIPTWLVLGGLVVLISIIAVVLLIIRNASGNVGGNA